MKKHILTFVRGSGSVWVHLSTILRVQVWFRFTEVKFCRFMFGSGSPKWNGSFGFTVRVQVRFDTLSKSIANRGVASFARSGGAKLNSGGQRSSPKSEGFFWPKSQIFRSKAGDLQKKKGLTLAKIANSNVFSAQKHQLKKIPRGGKKKIGGGGGQKRKSGGHCPPCPPAGGAPDCKSNQIFHYSRWITRKRVTSWRGPSPRHCAQATQLLSKKCRSGGESLATLYPIWSAQDLNLRPPALETNALLLDQLAGYCKFISLKRNEVPNLQDQVLGKIWVLW